MRKLWALCAGLLLGGCMELMAVPANPKPVQITQPDGSCVTVKLCGDEFLNYSTTVDGYTIIQNEKGAYVYAQRLNGKLVPSTQLAHDAALRDNVEKSFVGKLEKGMIDSSKSLNSVQTRSLANKAVSSNGMMRAGNYDYSKFKGLVVLIEFSDRSFTYDKSYFEDMINKDGYNGYTHNGKKVDCTGSVHDYFKDNSMEQFKPQFDVVGPVKVNYTQSYINQTYYASTVIRSALSKAYTELGTDYSQYDVDGDGTVDMVYFIFAGGGSNVGGNNTKYVWPHQGYLSYPTYGGKRFYRYACSCEIGGLEAYGELDGIGTICHEFGHALGLMDVYDTDYEKSGGQSNDPGIWSIMSGGSYLNDGHTPAGYNIFERYSLGWANVETIDGACSCRLEDVATSNTGYRMNTAATNKEYFIFDNHQGTKWDAYLPGKGMEVFRVDSTKVSVWTNNTVNANPDHNYFEMVRASSAKYGSGSDLFPGTTNATSISNTTTPGSLKSWAGASSPFVIKNIEQDANGVITFDVQEDLSEAYYEDFEPMELNPTDKTNVKGSLLNWKLTNANVVATTEDYGTGERMIQFTASPAALTSTNTYNGEAETISFDVWNTSTASIKYTAEYSEDGTSWTKVSTGAGETSVSVGSKSNSTVMFRVGKTGNLYFRITGSSTSKTAKSYIDNIKIVGNQETSAIEMVGVNTANGKFRVCGNVLSCPMEEGEVAVYNLSGMKVFSGNAENGSVVLPNIENGLYLVKQGTNVQKVIVK